jgi:hypothetical protein
VTEELGKLGVTEDAAGRILSSMAAASLDDIEAMLGSECEAIADMRLLFDLAKG